MNRNTWMNWTLLSNAGNALTVALGFVLWLVCIVSVSWLAIRAMGASARQRRRLKSGMHRSRRVPLERREN